MNNTFPKPDLLNDDGDADLILTFLTEFHMLEKALIQAGFTKVGRIHGGIQVDWRRFVRHIERHFDPDSSPVLQGAVSYLLYDPDKLALRQKRLESPRPEEASIADSDILWLAELVQEMGNRLTHGISFLKASDFDSVQVMAALMVVEAWSSCDPGIKSLLAQVQ
jgi:hypothetical protein